mgnify:CR=1 FL=1
MYYRARYYHPALGRFVSADAMVPSPQNPMDFNRYAYVRNSPLNYTDPSGHAVDWGSGARFGNDKTPPPPPQTPVPQPVPTPPPPATPIPTPIPTHSQAPVPTGAQWVDELARLFGLREGRDMELPYEEIIDWDVWVGRVTYHYGVHVEAKGQGPVTIFPDRFKLGSLTVTEKGEINQAITLFAFSHGPASHKGEIKVSTYPFDFSSWKFSYGGEGKTEMEGNMLSVSVSQQAKMEVEIRPKQFAYAAGTVIAIYYGGPIVAGIFGRDVIQNAPVGP